MPNWLFSAQTLPGDVFYRSSLWFIMRLLMADVFFKSGLTKISDFNQTIDLFKYEYKVPIFSPEIAAIAATAGELLLPILLLLGLTTRFAAAGLFVMTLVIEFTYQHYDIHYFWALILSVLLVTGPGSWSLDQLISRRYFNK